MTLDGEYSGLDLYLDVRTPSGYRYWELRTGTHVEASGWQNPPGREPHFEQDPEGTWDIASGPLPTGPNKSYRFVRKELLAEEVANRLASLF